MQKIKWGLLVFVVGLFLFGSRVNAFTCTGWGCDYVTDPVTGGTSQTCHGTPAGCDESGYSEWICIDNPGTPGCPGGVSCGPGKYVCNRGCCNIGGGGSHQGGGETSCSYGYIVNCPPGYTRGGTTYTVTEAYFTELSSCGMQVGSAQVLLGSNNNPHNGDGNPTYNIANYQCYNCPSGSTLQCTISRNRQYQRSNCINPTYCGGDDYVSHYQSGGMCYGTTKCQNEECGWVDFYEVTTTCLGEGETCTCVNNCTQTAPTGLSIVAGPTVGTTARASWTLGTGGEAQFIWVDEDQAEVNAGCPTAGDCEMSLQLPAVANNMLVNGLTPLRTYYFRIINIGGPGCGDTEVTGTYTTPASTGVISGKVYLDSSNNCGTTAFAGQSVVLDGVTTAVTGADGSFTHNAALAATHNLFVTIPSGYTCSTGAGCSGCSKKTGVVSPSANNYFYLTQNRDAWWQAKGAGVYAGSSAGGVTIGSTIPNSVVDKYLVIPDGGSAAAVLRASGDSPSLGQGSVNSESWSAKSTYKGKRADYNYFAKEMGVVPSTTSDWQSDTLNQQTYNSSKDFWYVDPAGTAAISSAWQVANGEKYTVFVNGDLRIGADIVVAPGGFLAFIVKGDVTIDPAVANVQGLYVTQDNFITESTGTDVQLEVEGSVVAWGDISLARDMVANNSNSPAEIFRYRADLLTNMPDEMKSFVMQWKEVVPGTYESQ